MTELANNVYMVDDDGTVICGNCGEEGNIDGYTDESVCCPFYCDTEGCGPRVLCYNSLGIDDPCHRELSDEEKVKYEMEEGYKAYPIKVTHIVPNKLLNEMGVSFSLESEVEILKGIGEDVIKKYELEESSYNFMKGLLKSYEDYPEGDFDTADGLIGVCDNCKRVKYTILRAGD